MLSGIPATGKSTYGRWLAETNGVLHLDLENGDLDRHGLEAAWAASTSSAPEPPEVFVQALLKLNRRVAIDWGFPPEWLPFVKALHAAGVRAWWFDGDRDAARRRFIQRGTVPVQALDVQMRKIEAANLALRDFYGDRWLDIVHSDGTPTPWEDVYNLMFGKS
jgi:hypothetical protein